QGRHPLQTSDALGAAAAQLGPDAQAAVVELNKQGGLSHGKVTRCLASLFGIPLSRGGNVHTVLRAAARCEPVYEAIRHAVRQSGWLDPDETGWRVGGQPAAGGRRSSSPIPLWHPSSGPSLFNFRVKVLQLDPCVFGGEVPLDADLFVIAPVLPGRGF